jgi:hypothetical protein
MDNVYHCNYATKFDFLGKYMDEIKTIMDFYLAKAAASFLIDLPRPRGLETVYSFMSLHLFFEAVF